MLPGLGGGGAGGLKLAGVYVDIAAPLAGVQASFRRLRGMLTGMSASLTKFGRQSLVMGTALALPFGMGVKASASFEDAMSKVATMLDDTTMRLLPGMAAGVRKMSVEMGQSTKELTDALYAILSAQIPAADAMKFLGIASQTAVAGLTDANTAVLALTKIMAAYRMEMDQVSDASDFLFSIVRQGQGTVGDFARAMPRVTAIAAITGLRMEELGAAVSTTSRLLGNAQRSTFALSAALAVFTKATPEAVKLAKQYGVELNTMTLRTEGLYGVLMKLRRAPPEVLGKIFPRRALRGVAALLRDVEGYTRDLSFQYERTGLRAIAFEKRAATLSFQLSRLKEFTKDLAVEIGDTLSGSVGGITKLFISYRDQILGFIRQHKDLINAVARLAVGLMALGVAGLVLGAALKGLPWLLVAGGALLLAEKLELIDVGFTKFIGNLSIGGHKIKTWLKVVGELFTATWGEIKIRVGRGWDLMVAGFDLYLLDLYRGIKEFIKKFLGLWDAAATGVAAALLRMGRDHAKWKAKRTLEGQKLADRLLEIDQRYVDAEKALRAASVDDAKKSGEKIDSMDGVFEAAMEARRTRRAEKEKERLRAGETLWANFGNKVKSIFAAEAWEKLKEKALGMVSGVFTGEVTVQSLVDKLVERVFPGFTGMMKAFKKAMEMPEMGMPGALAETVRTLFTTPFMGAPTAGAFAVGAPRDLQLEELKKHTTLLDKLPDELNLNVFAPG